MLTDRQPSSIQKKLQEIEREAEERDARRRSERIGVPYVDLSKTPVSLEAVKLIPEETARAAQAAAVQLKNREVAIAAVNPAGPGVLALVQDLRARGFDVRLFVTSQSGLAQALYYYKFVNADNKEITGKVEIEKKNFENLLAKFKRLQDIRTELTRTLEDHSTTTALLEIILAGAFSCGASDVHLEPEEKSTRIRFRLDGVLQEAFDSLPFKNTENLVTRIKLLSGLKMNVHGEPQDGRFTINLPLKDVEMRVSIIPSEFGETVVMRILDPDAINVDLDHLGLRPDDLVLVKKELEKPNGLILNTGPTGSGKTTTLYAFLRQLASPEVKIITAEDPIEYRIPGVEQTQVNPEAGYTFANGLRAILRQDPDVILVGEIRDHETADIALQASLTGHLVLSTLHTNDAVGAVPRLADLEIKPATIGSAVTLVIAQRLVRKLCSECRKPATLSAADKKRFAEFLKALPSRVDRAPYSEIRVFEPSGCDKCNHVGYKGRIGIYEFFLGGAELEAVILKELSDRALRELAAKQGMVSMQADGVLKTLAGITSFAEVKEVTGPLPWEKSRTALSNGSLL